MGCLRAKLTPEAHMTNRTGSYNKAP
jgi:hypothetical protein